MSLIGGNTFNHLSKEAVIKNIKAWREKLLIAYPQELMVVIEGDLTSDISRMDWNELRKLRSRLQIRIQILLTGEILG